MLSFSRPLLSLLLSFHNIIPSLSMSFIPILIPSFLYLFNPSSSSLLTPFITYLLTPLSSLFPSLFPPHLSFSSLSFVISYLLTLSSSFLLTLFITYLLTLSPSFLPPHFFVSSASFPRFIFVIPAQAGTKEIKPKYKIKKLKILNSAHFFMKKS